MNTNVVSKLFSSEKEEKNTKPKKKVKNVFTYMESINQNNGPKSLLYKSIKENRRIKVWTRSHSYVRSICTGYLSAFDQYWNLAMTDVDEIYRIPSNQLENDSKSLLIELESSDLDESQIQFKDIEKKLNLYKNGRFNLLERHVNQLFIRGDNIVIVTLAD